MSVPSRVRTGYSEEVTDTNYRMITMVYDYDPDDGKCIYGASVFRKTPHECDHDHWCKKKHRTTALSRFNKRPVVVNMEPNIPKHEVLKHVRGLLFAHGVAGPKNKE